MSVAEDIAMATLMLLSDAARFVTGVVLPVDGGLLAGPFIRGHGVDLAYQPLLEAGIYSER
jgi:hypothetical protein